ncbi:MAG: ATP-dependent DNA helicase RecG [Candidatus Poribacteria bacterium]|jgi:ATP-dependent DNA helicase RecG|nr:ATP-dependent DNA helicase RecG [Candidatus Poribacteria bacterium]MDP6748163.1 ATP-dependent DNA helicase RecG [Candidatus Poribacteria bacterium]MDP6997391.1 ATP-dependent DNA helicase RecG [Candidatus Poribacteria bacterium]
MATLRSILLTVQNLFEQEIEHGCNDNIVPGGTQLSVRNHFTKTRPLNLDLELRKQLRQIYGCFDNYPQSTPIERICDIEQAKNLVEAMLADIPANFSRPDRAVSASDSVAQPGEGVRSNSGSCSRRPIRQVSIDPSTLDFLTTSMETIEGVGPRSAAKLESDLGISTVGQLLDYFPRAYHDQGQVTLIGDVGRTGDSQTIQGKVAKQSYIRPRRSGGKAFAKIAIYDGTGIAQLVVFGNQRISYLRKALSVGTYVVVSGKFERKYREIQSSNFEFEVITDEEAERIHTGRIVPKYSLTSNLTQRSVRQWVKNTLDAYVDHYPEFLPEEIRRKYDLLDWYHAISEIHFPSSAEMKDLARQRLAFNELFLLQVWLASNKKKSTSTPGISFDIDSDAPPLVEQFLDELPFQLTKAQRRSFQKIEDDMRRPKPMNRLLQGDVGSGKTMVAALSLLNAVQCGYQGALMVPTEVLADQHAVNLGERFSSLGVEVGLLKGDLSKRERDRVLEQITDGTIHVVVGTQALIQESVTFGNLGLVVIDEQHRFGVLQRASLREKGPREKRLICATSSEESSLLCTPDVLVMTATPIPRTLSLTIYGDLNVSIIDELPPGRQEIKTEWVREKGRLDLYSQLQQEIEKGQQVYIVYPLVEESEKLEEIKAATEMANHLQNEVFPNRRVGLLHGRMKSPEKRTVMIDFKAAMIDILVSTTVIEVGVDIPNATIMVIENAERFGLAQLHQLRGRVGRGQHQSWCYLIASPKSEDGVRRIQAMTRTNNGFELAEIDLEIRGPGEFFGTRQSGLPEFRIADIIKDAALLEAAKSEAEKIITTAPDLTQADHRLVKSLVEKNWDSKANLIQS